MPVAAEKTLSTGNCYRPPATSSARPLSPSQAGSPPTARGSTSPTVKAVRFEPCLSIRAEVATVIGTSRLPAARLFTFGDRDGPAGVALFQHPLGLAFYGGALYVADTYNNRIKRIDLASRSVRSIAGAHRPGRSDSPPLFDEPAGISAAAGKLYVADTNNHLVRVIDLKDGSVTTLEIHGLTPPK